MQRIPEFFLILVTFAFFGSCNKSHSTPSSSKLPPVGLFATVNGVPKSFNSPSFGFTREFGGITDVEAEGTSATGELLDIGIDNFNSLNVAYPIVTGTFSDTALKYEVEQFYIPDSLDTYSGGSNYDGMGYTGSQQGITNHLQLTILRFDDTSFVGTFTGDVYFGGIVGQPSILITNGTFNVKFQ
jgi:hypothetical protein